MKDKNTTHPQLYVKRCREVLNAAENSADQVGIATAHANLAFALCNVRDVEEGLFQFDQAVEIAEKLQDSALQQKILGIKVLAYQNIGHLPDAYKTAGEILAIAEADQNQLIKIDALLSLGQIMLESGEPFIALEHYKSARDLAIAENDRRRMMNVMGAYGNYAVHVAETGKAVEYFQEARMIAKEIGDRPAEIGYLGNEATMLAYHNHFPEANAAFYEILQYAREHDDKGTELQALQHLVQINDKLNTDLTVQDYALQGITLAEEIDDSEKMFDFYQTAIISCYRLNQVEKAEVLTERAVAAAQVNDNRDKEVDFLVSLGESALNSSMPDKAFAAYGQARKGAVRLSRQYDEAYLTGRMGVALAEMDRIDEAIEYHKEAVALAKKREIPQLEGEQLSMLSLAYLDKGNTNQAHEYCEQAVAVYEAAEIEEYAEQAKKLLAEIS